MEDIRLYDFDFNLLHIENKIISSDWELFYNDIGKAEIHLPVTTDSACVLFDNKYLLLTQGKYQAIVTGKQIGTDCVIYAKTPNWILSKRTLLPFESRTGKNEEIVREFVSTSFSDVSNFSLGTKKCFEDTITLEQTNIRILSDAIKEILSACGKGQKVYFDLKNKKWVFEVISGKTVPVVISESNRTSYDTKYTYDLQEYFSCGVYIDNVTETAKDVVKDEKNGIYKWSTPILASDESSAKDEIKQYNVLDEITTSVRNLQYGTDYELGDIVTLQIECGNLKRTKSMKITGVNIWNESGNSGIEPSFEEI